MRIAVDVMGGDYALTGEIVKGAAEGSKQHDVDVIMVGQKELILEHLPSNCNNIIIHHTSDAISMHEHASEVRLRKDASVVVCARLVKEDQADAMVSVGNTAAAMATATLQVGRIGGIERPAIAVVYKNSAGNMTVMLDAGAVVDCTPNHMRQFALMGDIFARQILAIETPRVGLLSVGEEKDKGSIAIKAAHEELHGLPINFIGNIEGRHLFFNAADVIVTSGFAGNVALKTAEGTAEYIAQLVEDELRSGVPAGIPADEIARFFDKVMKRLDYSEYGGAPLFGLNGVCIVGHGRSKASAIVNAIGVAKRTVESGFTATLKEALGG